MFGSGVPYIPHKQVPKSGLGLLSGMQEVIRLESALHPLHPVMLNDCMLPTSARWVGEGRHVGRRAIPGRGVQTTGGCKCGAKLRADSPACTFPPHRPSRPRRSAAEGHLGRQCPPSSGVGWHPGFPGWAAGVGHPLWEMKAGQELGKGWASFATE